jgi:hypothetical protein
MMYLCSDSWHTVNTLIQFTRITNPPTGRGHLLFSQSPQQLCEAVTRITNPPTGRGHLLSSQSPQHLCEAVTRSVSDPCQLTSFPSGVSGGVPGERVHLPGGSNKPAPDPMRAVPRPDSQLIQIYG